MHILATQTANKDLTSRVSVLSYTIADSIAMADIVVEIGNDSNPLDASSDFTITAEIYIGGASLLAKDLVIDVQQDRAKMLLYIDPIPVASGKLIEVFLTSSSSSDSSVNISSIVRDIEPLQPATRGRQAVVNSDGSVDSDLISSSIDDINDTVDTALSDYDAPTKSELDSAVTSITNSFSDYVSATAVGVVSSNQLQGGTRIKIFQGETIDQSIVVYQSDGSTPYDLSGKTLEILFETESQELISTIANADITVSGDDNNIVTFTIPATISSSRKTKYWSLRDAGSSNKVYLNGDITVTRSVIKG